MTTVSQRPGGGMVIAATFITAFVLTILPLPNWLGAFRPEWTALVLIYWCLALPMRVNVGVGWLVGLVLDILQGALLGQHALGLTVVAYLAVKLHKQIRVYPLWQQALSVFVLVALNQLLVVWVKGIIGQPPKTWAYWVPSLASALIWPWLFAVLRDVRRKFGVA